MQVEAEPAAGGAVAAVANGRARGRKRPRPSTNGSDGFEDEQEDQEEQEEDGAVAADTGAESFERDEADVEGEMGELEEDGEEEEEEAQRRRRREELGEEDEEDAPLVAEGEVGANLRVWARTLERPPKGSLRSYSEGLWRPDKQLCRIIKPRGNDLRCMGFALEGDVHLYPEETLFLVERCKLEVGNATTPQLYEAAGLLRYLAYAYFKQTSLILFRAEPRPEDGAPPPPAIAFEAYAPTGQFSKKQRGRPIMYIMFGGTREPVPTEAELLALFEWAGPVPLKYAMVSDEGGVFAVNLAPRPLENHTHLAALAVKGAAKGAAAGGGGGGRLSWREKKEQKKKRKAEEAAKAAQAAAEAAQAAVAAEGGDAEAVAEEAMDVVVAATAASEIDADANADADADAGASSDSAAAVMPSPSEPPPEQDGEAVDGGQQPASEGAATDE